MAEKEQKTRAYQYKNKEIPARVQAYIQEHRMFERGETVITDRWYSSGNCTLQSGINCKKEETIYGGSRQKYPKRSV